jgi:hypothetical protein
MIMPMRRALLAAVLASALVGCGGKDDPTDPLAFVPADSPYVLANRTPMSSQVLEAWMQMYGVNIEELYAEMAKDPQLQAIEGEFGEWLRAALPEVGKMGSVSGLEQLGFKVEGRFALYGYGLMPVYRWELSDPKRFAETVARIEDRAGKKLAKRKLGDTELWQFANDKATVLFGTVGGFFVMTLAPANADEARLGAQIGLTLPEASMASSAALDELDKKFGYDGHMSGYIDIRALAQRLTGRNQEDNQVITAFGGEIPKLSDACAAELDSMTQKFPRMVIGTTRFDARQMNVNSLLEVEPGLAQSLQKIAAPVPGAGAGQGMMFQFAASVDLPETVRFLNGVADAIAAQPYQCEELKDINASAAEMKQNLANPGLAMAGAMNAVNFGLKSLKMEAGNSVPSALSAYVTIGSSSPLMLWGLAQQGVPPLAQVQLATDGKIVALPTDGLPMPIPLEFKALMTDKSIGIATTDIADADFTAAATVPAAGDGTVLMYGFSGEFFGLIGEQIPAAGPEVSEKEAREIEQGRQILTGMAAKVDHMNVRVQLTARGIEFVQENSLK